MTTILKRPRRLPLSFRTWLALTSVVAFAVGFSVPLQLEIARAGATRPVVIAYAGVFAVVALCHVLAQIVGRRYRPASLAPAATGFTLIELIVVILILGILAAIGTLAYNGVVERAHYAAAKTELAQAGHAIAAQTTHDGATPDAVPDDIPELLGRFARYEYRPTGQAFTLQGITPNLCFTWPGGLTDGLCARGDGVEPAPSPSLVPVTPEVVAVSGTGAAGLFLDTDGHVYGWDDTAAAAVRLPVGVPIAAIAGSSHSALLLGRDGCLYAWDSGALTAAGVPAPPNVLHFTGHAYSGLIRDMDGRLFGWDGSTVTPIATPEPVASIAGDYYGGLVTDYGGGWYRWDGSAMTPIEVAGVHDVLAVHGSSAYGWLIVTGSPVGGVLVWDGSAAATPVSLPGFAVTGNSHGGLGTDGVAVYQWDGSAVTPVPVPDGGAIVAMAGGGAYGGLLLDDAGSAYRVQGSAVTPVDFRAAAAE